MLCPCLRRKFVEWDVAVAMGIICYPPPTGCRLSEDSFDQPHTKKTTTMAWGRILCVLYELQRKGGGRELRDVNVQEVSEVIIVDQYEW